MGVPRCLRTCQRPGIAAQIGQVWRKGLRHAHEKGSFGVKKSVNRKFPPAEKVPLEPEPFQTGGVWKRMGREIGGGNANGVLVVTCHGITPCPRKNPPRNPALSGPASGPSGANFVACMTMSPRS